MPTGAVPAAEPTEWSCRKKGLKGSEQAAALWQKPSPESTKEVQQMQVHRPLCELQMYVFFFFARVPL